MTKKKFNIRDYFGILPREDLEKTRRALKKRREEMSNDMEERREKLMKSTPNKKSDLRPLFGILKTKESGQHFKDEVKEGWEPKRRKTRK